MAKDCSQNEDPLRLVREGTSQDERAPAALAPASAPADARQAADDIVFAQGYAALLKRYSTANAEDGNWRDYFGADLAVPLATAAVEDVDAYRTRVRECFDFLNNLDNAGHGAALRDRLGWLYTAAGAVAEALDGLHSSLPDEAPLKGALATLIQARLAPAFKRLVGYYKGGVALGVVGAALPAPELRVLRHPARAFADVLAGGLSSLWGEGAVWHAYVGAIVADASVYGAGGLPDPFVRINHCATHNLFRSVFDLFLQALARTVNEARSGLDDALENDPAHAPHYALFLAFLRLLAHARDAGNALTQKHLDFYYSSILGLKPRAAQPGHVHLLAELSRQASRFDFTPGLLFKAGKDAVGKPAFFASVADMVANKASVASVRSVYRHGAEPVASGEDDDGRVFASPAADSGDGQGAPLPEPDPSWHPFFNKRYVDGALAAIAMPRAQLGFAIASHYLLAAEGKRTIGLRLVLHDALPSTGRDFAPGLQCLLSTAKGWLAKPLAKAVVEGSKTLHLSVELDGADDAIVPYAPKVHGYNFDTDLPLVLVLLRQDPQRRYAYADLEGATLDQAELEVSVSGMRTLVAANDFGPLDLSKPFQPFGAAPVKGAGLVVGSKEIFQKQLTHAQMELQWQTAPVAFSASANALSAAAVPTASIDFLSAGSWTEGSAGSVMIAPAAGSDSVTFTLDADAGKAVLKGADLAPAEAYGTSSRHGFVRIRLDGGFGQEDYQKALIAFLRKDKVDDKDAPDPGPRPPQGPVAAALTMGYTANTKLKLASAAESTFAGREGRFFHVAPFGTAERHAWLASGAPVPLLPPLRFARGGALLASEAEFYIGIAGLAPPQSLSLLFQVADGTANPLARKPAPHIDWSYLANDQWLPFPQSTVVDATGALLNSGIVSFAVPREASSDNRVLPAGQHWIRAAVHEASDAVCRLRLVAAQALEAVFADQGNAPEFSATPLPPGSVAQLAAPDPAVKRIAQPYPSFGGRGAERLPDFYRRVSERLRHKNRAIDLWDYERLVLEAFPQIYKIKCLNHTQYEPAEGAGAGPCSGGIYRELAPGHVTLVALPDLRAQRQRDPLKPYTSLGLLSDIEAYLARRCGGFVKLHVKNPQFEEVRVSFALKLRDGYDEAYSTTQLQAAITRFLSPWAFGGAGAPAFGGKVHKSTLIHFVEGQDCVDYVTDFRLFQDIPCQPPDAVDLDQAAGLRALSILVSAPAGKHQITVIRPDAEQALTESCGCDG